LTLIIQTHKQKIISAMSNPKFILDYDIFQEALDSYEFFINQITNLKSKGNNKVMDMVNYLNEYKDYLELELMAKRGTPLLNRQKGQLKLDNSVIEEFLNYLLDPEIISNIPKDLYVGNKEAISQIYLNANNVSKPQLLMDKKNYDFVVGKELHMKLSFDNEYQKTNTMETKFILPIISGECKTNFDKVMYMECSGIARSLKAGCPLSKYFIFVEFLDMAAKDLKLKEIDNIFLLRHAKRLTSKHRSLKYIVAQRLEYPIDGKIFVKFVDLLRESFSESKNTSDMILKNGFIS